MLKESCVGGDPLVEKSARSSLQSIPLLYPFLYILCGLLLIYIVCQHIQCVRLDKNLSDKTAEVTKKEAYLKSKDAQIRDLELTLSTAKSFESWFPELPNKIVEKLLEELSSKSPFEKKNDSRKKDKPKNKD